MSKCRYEQLKERVRVWAKEKGILEHATPLSQWEKTQEEVEELKEALVANDDHEVKDAYGDILVTLINGSLVYGVDLLDCLEQAVEVIEEREGKMVSGVFVKDSQ